MNEFLDQISLPTEGRSSLRTFTFGKETVIDDPEAEIAEAVEAARNADIAVVVVGTNAAVESEGFDRADLNLPGHQDRLIPTSESFSPPCSTQSAQPKAVLAHATTTALGRPRTLSPSRTNSWTARPRGSG